MSEHFSVGTFITQAHRGRAEILEHWNCPCGHEVASRVRWERGGREEWIFIYALNNKNWIGV